MNNLLLGLIEMTIFIFLLCSYFYIGSMKPTRYKNIWETIVLYGMGVFFYFSRTIANVVILIAGILIILFNHNRAKHERRHKGLVG